MQGVDPVNYYPFFHRDHDADTKGLDFIQQGAYRKLLDLFFDTELPLTRNRLGLYKLVGATKKGERQAVDSVLHQFWVETDEGWLQKRAAVELKKMQARRKAAQTNGKQGGRPSKAETQSVMDAARLEHAPANPLGFGYGLDDWPEEEPTGFQNGNSTCNPEETQTESYLQSKPKNRSLRTRAREELAAAGAPGASEKQLAKEGVPVATHNESAEGQP